MKTKLAAVGKWHGILSQLGVDDVFLRNQHGACPFCGGVNRFRFDDKDGEGTYFCNSCGAGDGIKYAINFLGMDFKETCKKIDEIVGNVEVRESRKEADPSYRINKILSTCAPLSESGPVRKYLASRGVPASREILEAKSLPYYDAGSLVGNFPAMVCRMVSQDGELITLHITYLDDNGNKAPVSSPKKMLPTIRKRENASIRLTRIYHKIGIAEGIETALACSKLFNIPVWASATAGNMENFKVPEGVSEVVIYGDNDLSYRGQAAAYTLAHKLITKGIECSVVIPNFIGDFADQEKAQ